MTATSTSFINDSKQIHKLAPAAEDNAKVVLEKARGLMLGNEDKRQRYRDGIERAKLIDYLKERLALTDIEICEALCYLEDTGELSVVEDSGLVRIRIVDNKNISEFERWQRALQSAWLRANEAAALQVFFEETNALKRGEEETRERK
jgi:hypothetical protein